MGHFFNVMTNGWGAMGDYSAQVPVADRWRIAAYIRALQLSQTAKSGDVPAGQTGGEPRSRRCQWRCERWRKRTAEPKHTEAK